MLNRIVLYHSPYSPFSRSVLLCCHFLKLDVDVRELDLMRDEQLTPEFIKINPQHCVPTINDNGFVLWESRAILSYLMETKLSELVPTSPEEDAVVNQRLYSEQDGLGKKYADLYRPLFEGFTEISDKTIGELYEILSVIEQHYFSDENEWIAGKWITAADFAYVSTIAGLIETGASIEKYPRLQAWFSRCQKALPEFSESIEKGAQMFGEWVRTIATKGF